jgi:hypothetical protein
MPVIKLMLTVGCKVSCPADFRHMLHAAASQRAPVQICGTPSRRRKSKKAFC